MIILISLESCVFLIFLFFLIIRNCKSIFYSALKFYRKKEDVDADMEEMDTEDQSKTTGASTTFTLKMLLTAPDLRRPLFIAAMLQVIQQFSGINAVSGENITFAKDWRNLVALFFKLFTIYFKYFTIYFKSFTIYFKSVTIYFKSFTIYFKSFTIYLKSFTIYFKSVTIYFKSFTSNLSLFISNLSLFAPTFPGIDSCLMVTKQDFLEMEASL